MHFLRMDVGFEPVRMWRRRQACNVRHPYLLPYRGFPKKGSSNSTIKGLLTSQYTPFIGVPICFYLQLNYNLSISTKLLYKNCMSVTLTLRSCTRLGDVPHKNLDQFLSHCQTGIKSHQRLCKNRHCKH